MSRCFIVLTMAFCLPAGVYADVRLAGIFGDHMVLQQGVKLPVWGFAAGGEIITVSAAGQTVKTTANPAGKWRVDLEPLKATSTPIELTAAGSNTVTISDVLVGDVWLASGQSNMQYALKNAHDAAEEVPKADYPLIRLCSVGNKASLQPLEDRQATWVLCTPETAKKFSAVAYFFGKELQQATQSPVGLIGAYVSGTPAQSWTRFESLEAAPELKHYVSDLQTARDKVPAATNPSEVSGGVPTSLFNGMIAPLAPFALKGVIWYQGESNTKEYEEYKTLFPALIEGWRKHWAGADAGEARAFPFLFVQLPGFGRRTDKPEASDWTMLREAQMAALKLPNTAMVVTLDLVPSRALLHPKNKSAVGRRLALAAKHVAYGQDVEFLSPMYDSMQLEGGKVHIRFKNSAGGMVIGAPPQENLVRSTTVPSEIKGFTIAGADKKFVRANATIDGKTVIVWSDRVSDPSAVRYGWEGNPEVNLYNKAGLPAAPFRTDQWAE